MMSKLILFFVLSHVVSFLCSILEAVLLSCTNSYVTLLKKKKSQAGWILEDLKHRIDRPLAAILTLNTSAHTFGAAGVGAQVVELFGNQWLAFASIVLTLTMLYWTEMLPKTIGALYWKKLGPVSAYTIKFLIFLTYPFVVSFEAFARYISKGKTSLEKITQEEIRVVLEEGTQAGAIEAIEQDMVEGIFRLGDRRVGILMTPRLDIQWLDIKDSAIEIHKKIKEFAHTRLPVCDGDLNNLIGFVKTNDILMVSLEGKKIHLKELVHKPIFVPETMRVLKLLEVFKKNTDHIAFVTNEYGNIQGLVTLNDVLESIVGEIPAVGCDLTPYIQPFQEGSWLIDGMTPIDEFKYFFEIEHLPDDQRGNYHTIGGFCMKELGVIPKEGDSFIWQKYKFTILKMDGHRVDLIRMAVTMN